MALTPAEEKRLAELKKMVAEMPDEPAAPAPSIPEALAGAATTALPYAVKALDVTSAPVRNLLAKATGVSKEGEGFGLDVWNPEITTPSGAELLKRWGVAEGGALSDIVPSLYQEPGTSTWLPEKGGMLDPSGRGTLGTLLEMGTDIPGLITGGMKSGVSSYMKNLGEGMAKRGVLSANMAKRAAAAAKTIKDTKGGALLQAILNPTGSALERAGYGIYQSGVKPLDRAMVELGKAPISSSQLIPRNIYGGSEKILEDVLDQSAVLREKAKKITDLVDSKGVKVDMNKAMDAARRELSKMAQIPDNALAAAHMGRSIERNAALGAVPMDLATRIKTNLYAAQPSAVFEASKRTPEGARVRAAQAAGIRSANEAAAEKVQKGLGEKLAKVNAEWGSYLDADEALRSMAGRASDTAVPARSLGKIAAGMGGPATLASILTPIVRATPVRTRLGLGMIRAGGNLGPVRPSALIDSWLRRKLVEDQLANQQESPWTKMRQGE